MASQHHLWEGTPEGISWLNSEEFLQALFDGLLDIVFLGNLKPSPPLNEDF